jgi:aryl-alcohol dehydrogenase-like predicted oxidoreductase
MHRRSFLACLPASLAWSGASLSQTASATVHRRPIGRSGEALPVIGMGTWLTFDIGDDARERAQRREVLARFFAAGGGMIDSSPMYGGAQRLLGELLPSVDHRGKLVSATKVWTPLGPMGPGQIERSLALWGLPRFDVLVVHNLLNWRAHLATLRRLKDEGRVRHIGISTSHGRDHDEVERLLRNEPLDVLQITYNLADASAEPLMELARERGVAVVVNRPFDGGSLFSRIGGQPLPAWAREAGCADWAQYFLKWIVSHPAVTCAIPATRQPAHMDQNMAAGRGVLPDAPMRRRMSAHMAQL